MIKSRLIRKRAIRSIYKVTKFKTRFLREELIFFHGRIISQLSNLSEGFIFPAIGGHDGLARVAFRFGEEQNIFASEQRAFLRPVLGSSVEFHGRANRDGGQASFHFSFQFSRRRAPRQRKQFGSSSYAVVIVRIGRVLSRSCYVLCAFYSFPPPPRDE